MRVSQIVTVGVLAPLLVGCGGGKKAPPNTATAAQSAPLSPALVAQLRDAEHPQPIDFPAPGGRSLQALANTVKAGPQVGLAGSVLLPGANRVAFGLIGADQKFIYGRSALYVARSPSSPAQGPFLAPADSFVPAPAFLSKGAALDTADIKAIYATQITFSGPGGYAVLVVSRVGSQLFGAATAVKVARSSPIPNVGQRPPAISTDTVASAHGNLDAIDTRVPHDDMHRVDFRNVIGKRPVALLFATPLLCSSRVCGPVTDLELQLEHEFAGQVTFIHEEVYVANQANKGLRPQLQAFHLHTEPWLFTFNARGRVAARLEGAFGINAFRDAIRAALR